MKHSTKKRLPWDHQMALFDTSAMQGPSEFMRAEDLLVALCQL